MVAKHSRVVPSRFLYIYSKLKINGNKLKAVLRFFSRFYYGHSVTQLNVLRRKDVIFSE